MDGATEEILLQKLEELILDEDNIITVLTSCEKLDISLNDAKYILEKFVSDQATSSKELSITYLLSGTLLSGELCLQIVDGISLNEKKKSFKGSVNQTIYSVQKKNNIDFNLIALSERTSIDDSRILAPEGAIVGERCTERVIDMKVLPPLPAPKNFEKQKPSSFFKPTQKSQSKEHSSNVKGESNSSNDESKGGPNKKENVVKGEKTTPEVKKVGGIATFLSQSKKIDNIKQSTIIKEENCKKQKIDSVDELKENTQNEVSDEKPNIKKSNSKSNKTKDNKKGSDSKKRKRIIVDSESDDDIFGKDDDEKMEVVESDEEKPVVKPKSPLVDVPKNKRRKAVEKTYQDEEGYVVTRTEYVLVSASEDKEEKVEKTTEKPLKEKTTTLDTKEPLSKSKAKKGKTIAANQTTLMNFFKKK